MILDILKYTVLYMPIFKEQKYQQSNLSALFNARYKFIKYLPHYLMETQRA